MLGQDLGEVRREGATALPRARAHRGGAELLDAEHLEAGRRVRDASLVGAQRARLSGSRGCSAPGRTELARALFGADEPDGGTIRLDGRPLRSAARRTRSPKGLGFCSEDRKVEGIVPDMSVRENLTLARCRTLTQAGIIDEAQQREIVDRFIKRLGIKAPRPEQKIRELSGGNQQKVLLARWLCMNPRFLILDEPTRGIDVGAKAEIQTLIEELADEGLGVLMISSELEEIIEGSDRVFVLRDGRTVAEFAARELERGRHHGRDGARRRRSPMAPIGRGQPRPDGARAPAGAMSLPVGATARSRRSSLLSLFNLAVHAELRSPGRR